MKNSTEVMLQKAKKETIEKAKDQAQRNKNSLIKNYSVSGLELVAAAKSSLMVFGILFLFNLFVADPFGLADFIAYTGAVITGTAITPLLLPVIPGRAFAWKGWLLGMLWTLGFIWYSGWFVPGFLLRAIGYLLVLPSLSAYLAMNFTGSSAYTSFSGVIKEMKMAVPLIAISFVLGLVLLLINCIWA